MVLSTEVKDLTGIVGAGATYPVVQIVRYTIPGGAAHVRVLLDLNDFPDV